jgi:monofunctional biosynthetic peptidoglycan transglycosylase
LKPRKSARGRPQSRWWIWLALALLIFLSLPILQVVWVRLYNPPVTPLMLLRQAEARWSGHSTSSHHFVWCPLTRMPPDFLKFVFVAEDQRFFQHRGFDWREIDLARQHAARTGRKVRGASTITMQCARSLFLWQGRSYVRKGLEAYYTFWMETLLSKRRILELYANVIEMGDGVYGIEAAAVAHFGTTARNLDRAQSAALAALLPNPRKWNPREPSPKLAARIAKILRQEKQVAFPLASLR